LTQLFLRFSFRSNVLEELSIRAGIALSQKRVIHEITSEADDEDFQRNYHALSAQVVGGYISHTHMAIYRAAPQSM
jgi:hypothetical protein